MAKADSFKEGKAIFDAQPMAVKQGPVNTALSVRGQILVPDGWQPWRWAVELNRKATACEELHPKLAAEYRERAKAIRDALKLGPGGVAAE
jgi:hypothetical protein